MIFTDSTNFAENKNFTGITNFTDFTHFTGSINVINVIHLSIFYQQIIFYRLNKCYRPCSITVGKLTFRHIFTARPNASLQALMYRRTVRSWQKNLDRAKDSKLEQNVRFSGECCPMPRLCQFIASPTKL